MASLKQHILQTILISLWIICPLTVCYWTCCSSAPSTVPLTTYWILEAVLPMVASMSLLIYQWEEDPTRKPPRRNMATLIFYAIRSTCCSLTLTIVTTWIIVEVVKSLGQGLKPLNNEDRKVNWEEGGTWFMRGVVLTGVLAVWGILQAVFWHGSVIWFKRMQEEWEGAKHKIMTDEEDGLPPYA